MSFDELLKKLAATVLDVDASQTWPTQQFNWLAGSGVLGWVIPEEYGGQPVSESECVTGYERLATACLTTCFALTQRNGACQRIVGSSNEEIKAELLPRLASGESFATVGISHLTTSRQHISKPMVRVEQQGDHFILNGMIPWVTGAIAADHIVTGGTCNDGLQVLIAMPCDLDGISIRSKVELMSLTAAETTSIDLNNVRISTKYLLAGPVEGVMSQGVGGGAGSLTTSTLALGVSVRSLALLQEEAERRPDLKENVSMFEREVELLRDDVSKASLGLAGDDPQLSATMIRQRSNSLALRITQAALAVTKGAGFMKGHPAELAVREAMFFLVWSCPQPVVQGVLSELTCRDGF